MNNNSNRQLISRDEAERKGLKRYFTGQTCRRGHLAERYTSTGGCVDCLVRKVPTAADPSRYLFTPPKPFNFDRAGIEPVDARLAQAVFRYMQAQGWHFAALEQLRADPALLARYDHEPTLAEKFEAGH